MYYPKDFIETADGLIFAVVSEMIEDDQVLCFLRYIRRQGQWSKVQTDEANRYLRRHYPHHLFYSAVLDAELHAVSISKIVKHHQPRLRLAQLQAGFDNDPVEEDCVQLCTLLLAQGIALEQIGVTGSLLPGLQRVDSDIDLVFYDRALFHRAREVIKILVEQGACQTMAENDWLESYRRRDCDLSLQEYIWHEQRKFNKITFNRRKVDLTMLVDTPRQKGDFEKRGEAVVRARVTDDYFAFDYPAVFSVDHDEVGSVLCFTATYTGQARSGEQIEVAGQLERAADGQQRIIVGSTREARGEYIKVLHES